MFSYSAAVAVSSLLTRRALGQPQPATEPLAIVMNSGEASVSVIDMRSHKVIRTLPTFREPSHWALSPDRAKLCIADASGNALFMVDPVTGESLGHATIADPYQLGYTPDQRYLMVNALRLDFVDIYRADDLRLVKRLSVGSMPSHLDFSPDGKWSFNSMQDSRTLVSIDIAMMAPRWEAKVGRTPAGVLWHSGKVLVCVMGEDHVAQVDPLNGAIEQRIYTGVGPHNIFRSPDGKTIYVSNRVGGSLAVLDAATLSLRRTYPLHAAGPDDMGIAPDGKIWISLRFREQVAVLDPVTGTYETINVGRSPHGIFLNTEMSRSGLLTAEAL